MRFLIKCIAAVLVLAAFLCVGETVSSYFSLAVPGSIVGMILLVGALVVYGQVPSFIGDPLEKAMPHLSILFIPPILAISQLEGQSLGLWIVLISWLFVSWLVSFLVVAKVLARGTND